MSVWVRWKKRMCILDRKREKMKEKYYLLMRRLVAIITVSLCVIKQRLSFTVFIDIAIIIPYTNSPLYSLREEKKFSFFCLKGEDLTIQPGWEGFLFKHLKLPFCTTTFISSLLNQNHTLNVAHLKYVFFPYFKEYGKHFKRFLCLKYNDHGFLS